MDTILLTFNLLAMYSCQRNFPHHFK